MHQNRPKNLNLFTIRLPIPAIVSICHRLSGFIFFLFLPFLLYVFQYSLTMDGYLHLRTYWQQAWVKLLFLAMMGPVLFHILAGIRHLLSDIHLGDTLKAGRVTAFATFILTFVLLLLLGIWIW